MEVMKVFVASDPNMGRAERALAHSIERTCSGPWEIHWMKRGIGNPMWEGWNMGRPDVDHGGKPYSGKGWATDFTCFRFAIPAACEFQGRAIYMDVDVLVLRDLRELWETPMHGAHALAKGQRTDVMLMDCAKFEPMRMFHLEVMKPSGRMIQEYIRAMKLGLLETRWNTTKYEDFNEDTCVFHYTNMRKQPWEPHPKAFNYPSPVAKRNPDEFWWRTYAEALEEGNRSAVKYPVHAAPSSSRSERQPIGVG